MISLSRTGLLLAAMGLALSSSAQVYKWTDANGRTHYGDAAPDSSKATELKISVSSYDGPPKIDDWAAIIRRPTTVDSLKPKAQAAGLTMYSTSWCGYCRLAHAYLAQKGIAYRDVNVEASDENRKEFAQYGGGGVPLFISGTKRMRGFSAASMDQLIASSR